jgi:hypothetical protein
MDAPPMSYVCTGQFDSQDEECEKCNNIAYCIAVTNRTDYIDAEFQEVNKNITEEN